VSGGAGAARPTAHNPSGIGIVRGIFYGILPENPESHSIFMIPLHLRVALQRIKY
jgi:hypothetical protein